MFVSPASPGLPGVKVSVSFAGDQLKLPLTSGLMLNADCTLLVSIGLLNCKTMDDHVGMLVELCAGELEVTTGSSGSHWLCAMKILATVDGTAMEGVCA